MLRFPWHPGVGTVTARRVMHGLLRVLALSVVAAPAFAQDADPAAAPDAAAEAPPAPTLDEGLAYLNELLANNPSPWRPCRSSAKVELAEDGYISITTARTSYCEDTQVKVHVRDLDPSTGAIEVDNEGRVSFECVGGADCARHFQKRKKREDDAWTTRDEDWIPRGPLDQPHLLGTVTLPMASDLRVQRLVRSSFAYVVRSAARDARYPEPPNPFEGRVAAAVDAAAE